MDKGRGKKNGLFSDIDHISFNTHPPFQEYKIFWQLNFNDISALIFNEAFPYLKIALMIGL